MSGEMISSGADGPEAQGSGSRICLVPIALYIVCLFIIAWILILVLSAPPSPDDPLTDDIGAPTVTLEWGLDFEIEVSQPSRKEPLDNYKVTILRNATPWSGFPRGLSDGCIGVGPAREYVNFTDLTRDGNLTGGDFFTMENLESGSRYEIVLLWAADDNKIASHVINVP